MDVEKTFTDLGGRFISPFIQVKQALESVEAFIFDWDGVFNDGKKTGEAGSPFSEVDSMGINILRFEYWLRNRIIPQVFVITGINNQSAANLAKREHYDMIFLGYKDKKIALDEIHDSYNLKKNKLAFVFDDILDIELAKSCGLSFLIGRKSNPLFRDYVLKNQICDYITANPGERHAVREICELLIGIGGNYDLAVERRIQFSGEYETYLKERNEIITRIKEY